ncbi:MAG TPA: serine/threonine-protein kinase [Bryobacteraceae bacterium]|jgi:serine/threonine-protein kinase|nr:serine/threonine-protein kinase [Bryobacteraceae bacterium]
MPPNLLRIEFEKRKRALFEAVRDLTDDQQARAISMHAGDNPELAAAVWKLLRASRPESDGVLNRPLYNRPIVSNEHPMAIGKYLVERHVGNGGMGSIYACREPQTGSLVAVKIIRSDIQGQAARQHFKRERDILMRTDHPNICRILDANIAEQGTPFIVMQFVEGKPLDQYCRENPCPIEKKLLLFSQVLAGVDYLHGQNIVHRDLKPSNLLVTANGSVRILDFGVAKMIEHAKGRTGHDPTATKASFMTLPYASPEQLMGTLSGRASDIYSLGVICYELLTGRLPASGECRNNAQLLLQALKSRTPWPPSRVSVSKGITESIDNLVLNALQFQPEARYSSAALFLSDLRRCLEGGTVPRRQPSAGASASV